jgi:hypothetical protein
LLSGSLDDGTSGMGVLRAQGGVTIAQDPADALYPGMPASAVAHDVADHVVPLRDMAGLISNLIETPLTDEFHPPGGAGEDTAPDSGPGARRDRSDFRAGSTRPSSSVMRPVAPRPPGSRRSSGAANG